MRHVYFFPLLGALLFALIAILIAEAQAIPDEVPNVPGYSLRFDPEIPIHIVDEATSAPALEIRGRVE